jgi:hypothetical protein
VAINGTIANDLIVKCQLLATVQDTDPPVDLNCTIQLKTFETEINIKLKYLLR